MFTIYNLFNQYFRYIDHPTAGSIQIPWGWRLDQASAKGSQSAMKFEKKMMPWRGQEHGALLTEVVLIGFNML